MMAAVEQDKNDVTITPETDATVGGANALPILTASFVINLLSITTPIAALLIYDRVLPNSTVPTLGVLLFGVCVIIIIDALLRISRVFIITRVGARIDYKNRNQLVKRFLSRRYPNFHGMPVGILTATLASVNTLRELKLLKLQAFVDIPFGVSFIVLIALIGGWLALIPASACLLFALIALWIARGISKEAIAFNKVENAKQKYVGTVFTSFRAIKSMASEIPLIDKFVGVQEARSAVLRQQIFSSMLTRDVFITFSQVLIGAVVVSGALAVLNGEFTFGGLAACTLLAGRALEPMQTGYQLLIQSRMRKVIDGQLSALSASEYKHEIIDDFAGENKWVKAPSVEFKDISIAGYNPAYPVFDKLNLQCPAGKITVIQSGKSGGKSRLANVLLGLVNYQGEVFFDETRVDEHNINAFRRQICFLPRVPDLPSGTIIDVLSDGEEGDYADIRYLSHLVGLDEIVKRLPEGYETRVGLENQELPLGFQQLIAIVRGIAKKHKVLVLDDTTFALDATSEMRLSKLLKLMKGTSTVVIFSDRPTLHGLADHIYNIEAGQIKSLSPNEEGAHHE